MSTTRRNALHSAVVFSLILTLLLHIFTGASQAAGGMGGLSSNGVSDTNINLIWNIESKFTATGSPPYKICYKVSGDLEGACNGGTVLYTSGTSYTLSGLSPSTTYKIKVLCQCKKNGKHQKERKVATMTATTRAAPANPPAGGHGSMQVINAAPYGFQVEWSYSNPSQFTKYRICYKRNWNLTSLHHMCKQPSPGGDQFGQTSGWRDLAPASGVTDIGNLNRNRAYILVLYGVHSSDASKSKFIGEVKAKTFK